jgi:glycosyltransferase involved in cell wall biosynthesis
LTYTAVTPARNEVRNLQRLCDSLATQTHPPVEWVIAVDGSSDDGTTELAEQLAAEHPWITVVCFGGCARGGLADGRREARDLESFRAGIRAMTSPADIVVKQDADTSFGPDYFARLLERFETEPRLGIAGGACYELERGVWERKKVMSDHPRGASRAYRAACLDDVMELEPRMGWDGIDEAMAARRGYVTRGFVDLPFRHHRQVGGRDGTRFRHGVAQGRASWYMGYRFGYLLLRSLYRLPSDTSAVGMIWGYLAAFASGDERCPDREAVSYVREQQRVRTLLRRGAPP